MGVAELTFLEVWLQPIRLFLKHWESEARRGGSYCSQRVLHWALVTQPCAGVLDADGGNQASQRMTKLPAFPHHRLPSRESLEQSRRHQHQPHHHGHGVMAVPSRNNSA